MAARRASFVKIFQVVGCGGGGGSSSCVQDEQVTTTDNNDNDIIQTMSTEAGMTKLVAKNIPCNCLDRPKGRASACKLANCRNCHAAGKFHKLSTCSKCRFVSYRIAAESVRYRTECGFAATDRQRKVVVDYGQ